MNRPAAPAFSATRLLPDQQFQFTLGGTAGARYLIEYSDDLVQWQELTTVTMTASTATLSDPEAGTKSKRFYRARAEF